MFCFSLASVLTETVIDVYSTTASSRGFTSHLIGTADFQSGASYSTAFRNNPIPDRVRITSGSDATGWYTVYPGATYETPCSSGAGTGCNSVSLRLNPVSGSPKHPTLFTSSLLAMAAESASTSASIARPCHSRATATAGKRATRWGRRITRIVSAPYAAGAAGGPTRWSDGVTWPPRCSLHTRPAPARRCTKRRRAAGASRPTSSASPTSRAAPPTPPPSATTPSPTGCASLLAATRLAGTPCTRGRRTRRRAHPAPARGATR